MNKYILFCVKHPITSIRQKKAISELSDLCSGYEQEVQNAPRIKQDMSCNCCQGYDYIIMNQRYMKGLESYEEWKRWYNNHCAQCTYMNVVCRYSTLQAKIIREVK